MQYLLPATKVIAAMIRFVCFFIASSLLASATAGQTSNGLQVRTQQGDVHGSFVLPTVRQFLGIPYAMAGRWEAPTSPPKRSATFNAKDFGDSCTQRLDVEFLTLAGLPTAPVPESDNCQNLNIWAPDVKRKQGTAVLLWIYGGSFQFGTSNFPVYDGTNFVRDHDDLTVVTINYRTNIFGQPNAPQLVSTTHSQNFGLLDVEAAVRWVHSNIAAFGGDPERITIFGESAGATTVDAYAYSHPSDTIVKGIITESGTLSLISAIGTQKPNVTTWNQVANAVGCGSSPTLDQLSCMKAIDAHALEQATIDAGPDFKPVVDEITLFSNVSERAAAGDFLHVPMLGGTTAQEGDIFVLEDELLTTGHVAPGFEELSANLTRRTFTCPASTAASDRVKAGLPTWRYQYQGIFPDISQNPNLRAYHTSEIPMVFGTYNFNKTAPPPTLVEIALSRYMQAAWVTFARDPVNGLKRAPFAWPEVNNGKADVVLLGNSSNPTGAVFVPSSTIDVGCGLPDILPQ